MVAARGKSSWSPRCPSSTSATCALSTSATYVRARVREPGSGLPVATMCAKAKPSGTNTVSGIGLALQAHAHAPDHQLVPVAQGHRPVDPMPVDIRAVGAPLVLHEPGT